MTHQFTNTNGKEFLAVVVPLEAKEFRIHKEMPIILYYDIINGFEGKDMVRLPFPCKIIGISSELTEEQIIEMGLVEGNNGGVDDTMFRDYLNHSFFNFTYTNRVSSLKSRLKSLGFVLENEFGEKPTFKGLDSFTEDLYLDDALEEWKEAESKIVKVLILKII